MKLAGGPLGLNDLFASRVSAFFRQRAFAYDVTFQHKMVVAIERAQERPCMFMLGCEVGAWRDQDPTVTYTLEGFDIARGIIPEETRDILPAGDELLVTFNALAWLIEEWPEIVGR